MLGAGGFDLIALDLGDERPRLPTAGWVRLKHGAERQGTTVLVAAPARAAGAFAAAAVELAPGAPRFVADGAPLFAGLRARAVRGPGRARAGAAGVRGGAMRLACVFVPQLALQAVLRRTPEARGGPVAVLEARRAAARRGVAEAQQGCAQGRRRSGSRASPSFRRRRGGRACAPG